MTNLSFIEDTDLSEVPGNGDLVGEAPTTNVIMELETCLSRVVASDTLSDSE
jgi:hypothetical protein